MRSLKTKKTSRRSGLYFGLRKWFSFKVWLIFLGSTCLFLSSAIFYYTKYGQELRTSLSRRLLYWSGKWGYHLDEIIVEGRQYSSPYLITKAVDIYRGQPIFSQSLHSIKTKLEQIPWVHDVEVKRILPNKIKVTIHERIGVALWQHKKKFYLVDQEGVVVQTDSIEAFTHLPIIVGTGAPHHIPQILNLLEHFPSIKAKVKAMVWVGGRRWDLKLDNNIIVRLSDQKIEEALAVLALMIQEKKINPEEVEVIDLRTSKNIVMKLTPVAALRLKGKGSDT
ncbi:MAG: FtsQ-type POTRA domain-containing protein [Proteobacteria bacterium]|nr:FtsQ-type POTRA domain-containing protein [Pseudomonadota bacterium]